MTQTKTVIVEQERDGLTQGGQAGCGQAGCGGLNGFRANFVGAPERKRRGKLAVVLLCLLSLLAVGCLRADMSMVVDDSEVSVNLRMVVSPLISSLAGDEFWDDFLDSYEPITGDGFSTSRVEEVSDPDGWKGVSVEFEGPTSAILTDVIDRFPTDQPQLKRTDTGWHFYWESGISPEMMEMGGSFGDFDFPSSGADSFGKAPGFSRKGDLPWKSFESPRRGFAGPRDGFDFFQKDDFTKDDYESFLGEDYESFLEEFDSRFGDFSSSEDVPSSWEDFVSLWEDFASRMNRSDYFEDDFDSPRNGDDYSWSDGDDYLKDDGDDYSGEDSDSFWEEFLSNLGESGLSLDDFGFLQDGVDLPWEDVLPLLEGIAPLLDGFDFFGDGEDSLSNETRNAAAWTTASFPRNDSETSEASRKELVLAMEGEDHMEDFGDDSGFFNLDDWGLDGLGLDPEDFEFEFRFSVTLPGQLVDTNSEDVTSDGATTTASWADSPDNLHSVYELQTITAEGSQSPTGRAATTTGDSSGGLGLSLVLTIIFGALLHIALITFVITRNRQAKEAKPEDDSPSPDDDPHDSPSGDSPPPDAAPEDSPPASDAAPATSDDSSADSDAGKDAAEDSGDTPSTAEDSGEPPPAPDDSSTKQEAPRRFGSFRKRFGRATKPEVSS